MNSSTSKRVCFHLVAAGREGGIAEIRGSAQHKVPMLPLPVLVSTRLYTRIFQCSQKFQARPSTALCTLNPQSFHPGRDSGGGGGVPKTSLPTRVRGFRSTLGLVVPSRPDQSLSSSATQPSPRSPTRSPGPPRPRRAGVTHRQGSGRGPSH